MSQDIRMAVNLHWGLRLFLGGRSVRRGVVVPRGIQGQGGASVAALFGREDRPVVDQNASWRR
jgi:hypothetical protein